jgi:hypothetical protein
MGLVLSSRCFFVENATHSLVQDESRPLHWAALRGSVEIAELLLADGRIDVNAKDKYLLTPLEWVKRRDKPSMEDRAGKAQVARLLLSDARVVPILPRAEKPASDSEEGYERF